MKREGARPVAVLEVRRPASVSQYVRRFRLGGGATAESFKAALS